MKKHIIGLALFSFIVSAAAIVYAVFNVPKIIPVPAPQYNATNSPTSCWKMKRDRKESKTDLIEVKQAVFDLQTKQLYWELAKPKTEPWYLLHIFIRNENGTKYVSSKSCITSSELKNKELKCKSSLRLDGFDSYENLYVIAEYTPTSKVFNKDSEPNFDINKATAVTIDYGK